MALSPAPTDRSGGSLAVSPAISQASPIGTGLLSSTAAVEHKTMGSGGGGSGGGTAPAAAAGVFEPWSALRALGEAVSDGAKKSYGRYVPPLLASIVVRAVTLEKSVEPKPKAAAAAAAIKRAGGDAKEEPIKADEQPFPILSGPLSSQKEQELINVSGRHRIRLPGTTNRPTD